MVDRIRWDTVSYLPFYYVFFQFLLLTIFNLQANILTTKDILSNLAVILEEGACKPPVPAAVAEITGYLSCGCLVKELDDAFERNKHCLLFCVLETEEACND